MTTVAPPFAVENHSFNYEPTQESHHPFGQNWADLSGSGPFMSTPLTGNGREQRFVYMTTILLYRFNSFAYLLCQT